MAITEVTTLSRLKQGRKELLALRVMHNTIIYLLALIAKYLILRLEQSLGKAHPELVELYITWNKVQVCIPAMY